MVHRRSCLPFLSAVLGVSLALMPGPSVHAQASKTVANPVSWSSVPKSAAWPEQLIGEVVTYQTLAERGIIKGNFQPYVDLLVKVRSAYRAGDRKQTYDGVNQFMTMLEVRAGEIDRHAADAIWEYCYRITPEDLHSVERHARMRTPEDRALQEFLRDMEEKASYAF